MRIFIGSSMEGEGLAERVAKIIENAGMTPVLWRTIFPAGEIILSGIERLATSVDGAVLIATPDLTCVRTARNEQFSAPVPNIVFEYGYLSARLSRARVAICSFDGAEMPSDLQGLTVVRAGAFANAATTGLSDDATASLRRWLASLVPLAEGIPPMRRLHGYSGEWNVQNRFTIWHGITLGPSDKVSWDGKSVLCIPDDGRNGYGRQNGQLKVTLGDYRATWDVANDVINATVGDGSLLLRVKVVTRTLVKRSESGTPPSNVVREALPSPEWDVRLKAVPGAAFHLEGHHDYAVAAEPYSVGVERYTYADRGI